MIDVAVAIDAEAVDVTHTPKEGGAYDDNGVWVPNAATPMVIKATVQPVTGRMLQDLPEGLRQGARYTLRTRTVVAVGELLQASGWSEPLRVLYARYWPSYTLVVVGGEQ